MVIIVLFLALFLWGWKSDEAHHYLGRFHNQVSVLREGREKSYLVGVIQVLINSPLHVPHNWSLLKRTNVLHLQPQ